MTDKTPVFVIDENMMATDEGADTAIKAFLGAAMSAGIDFHVHAKKTEKITEVAVPESEPWKAEDITRETWLQKKKAAAL